MSSEVAANSPVIITPGAREQILRILNEENISDQYGLRIGIKGNGCAGISYLLGFDLPTDNDRIYHSDGFSILMDKSQAVFLIGMEIDWIQGANGEGFLFKSPDNALKP